MKTLFKPGSRLIILFILTMIISGGILAYLSITAISNFKELTEKKINEEQNLIADRISAGFLRSMEVIADTFSNLVMDKNGIQWSVRIYSDSTTLISNPFVISKTGEFLRPWFLEGQEMAGGVVSSTAYLQQMQAAERYEFRERNSNQAARYYQASLKYASSESDSAKSMNAAARVCVKMQNYNKAFAYYARIIRNYYQVLDNNGFPYAYYAVLNILKLNDLENTSGVFSEVEFFLSGLIDGSIPLNRSTSDILGEISDRRNTFELADSKQACKLDEYMLKIQKTLDFVDNYKNIIKAAIFRETEPEPGHRLGEYNVINEMLPDPGMIILINPGTEYSHGFCIEFDLVWAGLIGTDFSQGTEFEYTMDFWGSGDDIPQNADDLSTMTEISGYFPNQMMVISLEDPDIVEVYVKRRSWTYGIALILLLGAMLLGILLILRDIMREKRLSMLRSDFVSNVTHELKTPLTSIHLFAESVLLDRIKTEPGKKEYLEIIIKETERLKRIINNILDFSKREKGKIEYKAEKVNVTELILSALKDLNYWLVEKNFTVRTELEEDIIIKADRDAIKQVIINLLDNAIKYSGDRREINIRLSSDNKKIRMEFEDKGIGIPENQLDSIFDKFYRVNETASDGISGTGLGLTVVKEIVEAHNGEISVESKPDEGSIFTVLLNSS